MRNHRLLALFHKGISLLEVLLSLSIIAIILVMATRYYFVASNNNKINTTVSQIGGLVAAMHSYKGLDADYANISIQTLYDAGQLTNYPGLSVLGNAATMKNLWGKAITVASTAEGAMIRVILPSHSICLAMEKAFPNSLEAGIHSSCEDNAFTYEFP